VGLGARFGADGRYLAGGTDLLVQLQRGRLRVGHLIALHRVPGLGDIDVDGAIRIGAGVTHRSIEKAAALAGTLRALIEGAEVIGGHQVRNVATVGGNLANASPAADLVPGLLALDASVALLSPEGEREMPLEGFLVGPNETARRPGELLVRVAMPPPPPRTGTAFLKAGRRKAMEISLVCVAVRLTLDAGGERCREARIALGAVAPVALRAQAAERAVEGAPADLAAFERAAALAAEACAPIDDVRASARFRRHLVGVLVRRALQRGAERARAA
jgi:carbon-monoxide dehydrogenase medium subunit